MIKQNELIGVIGGAGVAATNKFLNLIEKKFTANGAFRDMHHPQMIIFQATQAPSRSMYLEGRGKSFILDYIEIATKLKTIGATKICMTCNTAHFAIQEIQKNVNIEFIDMIEETILEVQKLKKRKIGLIASDGCLKGKVYEKYIEKLLPNAQLIYPNITMQQEVTKGIVNTKNIHRFDDIHAPERPKNIFKKVSYHLVEQGAEIIILGCTDIRVDFDPSDFQDIKIVDSLEVLANKIFYLTKSQDD